MSSTLELDRVRKLAQDLQQLRSELELAQRLAELGSWQLDIASLMVRGSPEFLRQVDLSAEELLRQGMQLVLAERVHPEDRDRVSRAVDEAIEHGTPIDLETRMITPSSGTRLFRVLSEVERDHEGRAVRLLGSQQDITLVREAELSLSATVAAREVAAREHDIAQRLQHSLLPELPPTAHGLHIAGHYQPASAAGTLIGGDWLDVVDLGGGRTALVVGDVMGLGVDAAAIMAQLRAAVRSYALLGLPPREVVRFLDTTLRQVSSSHIATSLYSIYDANDSKLTIANAGHLPPFLGAPGYPARALVGPSSPPLGAGPFAGAEHTSIIPADSTLLFFTDGLIERRGTNLDEQITALAAAFDAQLTQRASLAQLLGALTARFAVSAADDDVAVLAVHLDTSQPRTARWTVQADLGGLAEIRARVAQTLAAWDVPASAIQSAQLAVSELLTNSVVHAATPAELRLQRTPTRLTIEVSDTDGRPPRISHPSSTTGRGRGLRIVASLASEWGTRPTSTGKTVWCTIDLKAGDPTST